MHKSREELHAEIRRITAEVRKLREEMERTFRDRTRPTRAFSHGETLGRGTANDYGPRPRLESLAERIGRMKRR